MGNYYSYKRISTDTERQNFNRQIKSLEKYATDHNIEYVVEFTEEMVGKELCRQTTISKTRQNSTIRRYSCIQGFIPIYKRSRKRI